MRGVVASVLCLMVGCTKANPAKMCSDGTCSNPNYPFCDVTGAVSGAPGTCITATCTANTFIECRDDIEVRCNVEGSTYNLTACDRGCDPVADGCRLCNPGETACTNGEVARCDASGALVERRECALGCFENEPRCRDIDPSNGLALYMDMVVDAPDLVLSDAVANTSVGVITEGQTELVVPTFLTAAQTGGPPIRVFVAVRVAQARTRTALREAPLMRPATA